MPIDHADNLLASILEHEGEILARIASAHIPELLDHGIRDGVPYVAVEWIGGRTLFEVVQELIRNDSAFGLTRALDIFGQILRAVEACHRVGVLHCDIKPENIMVQMRDGKEYIYLIDFGVAQTAVDRPLESDHLVCGTPGFVAPEVVAGGRPSVQSDIYSLGVLLFELLTLTRPFIGSMVEIVHAQHIGSPRASSVSSHCPQIFDAFLSCALAPDPTERFTDIADMRLVLWVLTTTAAFASAKAQRLTQATHASSPPGVQATGNAVTVAVHRRVRLAAADTKSLRVPGRTCTNRGVGKGKFANMERRSRNPPQYDTRTSGTRFEMQ